MNKRFFKGKKVLITGGTGSLGKAIIKYLKPFNCQIIVFSRDEGKQALSFGNDPSISRVIGDIRDFEKLNTTLSIHRPDYVIHTGALKRVDDMEFYPDECVNRCRQWSCKRSGLPTHRKSVYRCHHYRGLGR